MRTGARHRVRLWIAAAAIAVPGAVLIFPPAGQAAPLPDECELDGGAGPGVTCTYDETTPGAFYVVPPGVTEITVAAQGGAGADAAGGGEGGRGAIVTKAFSVTEGNQIFPVLGLASGGDAGADGGAGGDATGLFIPSFNFVIDAAGGGGAGSGADADGGDAGIPTPGGDGKITGGADGGGAGAGNPDTIGEEDAVLTGAGGGGGSLLGPGDAGLVASSGGGGGQSSAIDLGREATYVLAPAGEDGKVVITYNACLPAQNISIGDQSVIEGDPGDANVLEFEVSIAEPSDCATTQVSVASEDVDATVGDDYDLVDVLAFFNPGEDTVTFSVAITADDVEEMDEQLLLRITEVETSGTTLDGAVAGVSDDLAIGTILDDDAAEPAPEPMTPDEICDPANPPEGYEPIVGGPGDEVLNGGSGKQILYGDGGNDVLNGGSKKDILCGGDGDDILNGGGGKDQLYGQGGTDTLNGGGGKDIAIQ